MSFKKAAVFFWGIISGFLIAHGVCHAQTRVDLQVEALQIQPSRPVSKQPVEITASIRNNGSEPAENFYLSLEIKRDGKRVRVIDNIPVLSRLPRSGSGLSIPVSVGKLSSGSYEAVATVDPDDTIKETNEVNNERSIRFQVSE
jgi:hypothetical protein